MPQLEILFTACSSVLMISGPLNLLFHSPWISITLLLLSFCSLFDSFFWQKNRNPISLPLQLLLMYFPNRKWKPFLHSTNNNSTPIRNSSNTFFARYTPGSYVSHLNQFFSHSHKIRITQTYVEFNPEKISK